MKSTYEITFTGRKANAIGAFYEITAQRTAETPEQAIALLYEPLPIAYNHISRPIARVISEDANK